MFLSQFQQDFTLLQFLPLVFDKIREDGKNSVVIVVSPLLALMTDQVNAMTKRGWRAGYVSGNTDSDSLDMKRKVQQGAFQLVFFTPEALLSGLKWRQLLTTRDYKSGIVAIVVDEAHCVPKW